MKKRIWMLCVLPLLLTACATTGKDDFLQTDDPAWRQILDEKVDIDVDNVDLAELFCHTAAFADVNIVVETKVAPSAMASDEAFDDPIERVRVTLHKEGLARREVLRILAHEGRMRITLASRAGHPYAVAVALK